MFFRYIILLLFLLGHTLRPQVLHHEAKNSFIMDGFFDGIGVETGTIQLLCCPREIPDLLICVFFKDRSSGKTIPEGVGKEPLQIALRLRCNSSVTLINYEGNP